MEFLPQNYKYKIGHWLRDDFGGSIPLPEDLILLTKYLDISNEFINYICKSALKIQTVKIGEYKLPRDFINSDFLIKLETLIL